MHGNYDAKALTLDLGKHFEGINVAMKPYPCCRGIHPAIDAVYALVEEQNITAKHIQEIKLFVSEEHHFLLCTPRDAKLKPRNSVDAQFSMPWGVATAIARERVTLEDFSEAAIKSQDILEVADKIDVELDNTLERSNKVSPTRVKITTKQGEVYSKQVEDPLGSLQRPMSFNDCAKKFRDCAKMLDDEKSNRVIELIRKLEQVEDVGEIIGLLTKE